MTAIAPNTTIYAINVNLNIDGEDTILFSTLDQQRQYFYDRKVTILTNYTYQREHRNWLKVTDPDGLLDKCNYLMFVNESYENKRMYAFITEVNWINNETCEIRYQMDYIQTFLFDIYNRNAGTNHLPTCWVERQHSVTDEIGDNIQPENVQLGEYEYNTSYRKLINLNEGYVIYGVSRLNGDTLDNIYSGVRLYCFDPTVNADVLKIHDLLAQHTADEDILFAYMIPKVIVDDAYTISTELSTGFKYISAKPTLTKDYIVQNDLSPMALNGYTVKNKKMMTYPYNYLLVSDGNGNNMKLRYEFFTLPSIYKINLTLEYSASPSPMIKVYPAYYKHTVKHKEECLTISGFPLVSWAYSAYRQWLARSFTSNLIKIGATAVGAAVAFSMGMPAAGAVVGTGLAVGAGGKVAPTYGSALDAYNKQATASAIVSGASVIGDTLSQGYQASVEGNVSNGTFTNSGSDFATGSCAVYVAQVSVNPENAETIDNFFTLYGYAQNKLMQPNPEARMYYTYVKTSNINILGAMPQEAKDYIAARFNSGIRFWRDYTKFLDYSVNNAVRP